MLNSFSFFTVLSVAIASVIATLLFAQKTRNSKSKRTSMLWGLVIADDVAFLIGLVLISYLEPSTKLVLLSWLVFDFIASFSLFFELPAWIKISKLDESRSAAIGDLRTILIKMRYSFDQSFAEFKKVVNSEKKVLDEEELGGLISDFVSACENKEEPLNESLWSLTLGEITKRIDEINSRSKHPIPKLIDILALSGLSVLIAELLKLIG